MNAVGRLASAVLVVAMAASSVVRAETPPMSREQMARRIDELRSREVSLLNAERSDEVWTAVGLGAAAALGTCAAVASAGTALPIVYAVAAGVSTTVGGIALRHRIERQRELTRVLFEIDVLSRNRKMLDILADDGSNAGRSDRTSSAGARAASSQPAAGAGVSH